MTATTKHTKHTKPDTSPKRQRGDNGQAVGQYVPVTAIRPSPTNPRKHFDDDALVELAASIAAKGVLQPVLLRPLPRRGPGRPAKDLAYELVAGERRWLAAQKAGLVEIPAIVSDVGDREVLEMQYIENLQREDLTPMEEAEGYQVLLDEQGYTVEDLAAKLGKSKAYVYGVLKLAALPANARKLVESGQLSKSTAQLFARIPNADLRGEAIKDILAGHNMVDNEPSYRSVKLEVERRYMVELKRAPFNPKDAELLPRAGACTSCPKMTGNNRDEYPDGRADVCTDPACYRDKVKAHSDRLLATAAETGLKVLPDKECAKLFPHGDGYMTWDAKYVDLAEQPHEDWKQRRIYKEILGDHAKDHTVVARDGNGTVHYLVPKDLAKEALRKALPKEPRSTSDTRREEKLRAEVRRRMMAAIADAAERDMDPCPGWGEAEPAKKLTTLFRHLVAGLLQEFWDVVRREVFKRRGLKADDSTHNRFDSRSNALRDLVCSLNAAQCLGLLAECVVARKTMQHGTDARGKEFFRAFGIDLAKIEEQVRAEFAKKKKALAK